MSPLNYHEAHLWSTSLTLTPEDEQIKFLQLSHDEQIRAQRLHFPIHKTRFIAAHSALREIAGRYLQQAPKSIQFAYNDFKKPFLKDYPSLQFNLSHSADRALIAFTKDNPVGVDIELMKELFTSEIITRYCHSDEIAFFNGLPNHEKCAAFFQLWTRKEALIKAVGQGLKIPLNSFAVSLVPCIEKVTIENHPWIVQPVAVNVPFCASIATATAIQSIQYFNFP